MASFEPAEIPVADPESASALAMMGLDPLDLCRAAQAGNDEALECTDHDVISRPGYLRWATPMRYLRDIYVPQGFSSSRPRNFEVLVSPDKTFAITVAPGDYATGLLGRMPSTRIERGPLTGQAVVGNRFQRGFEDLSPEFAKRSVSDMKIWLLLQFYDEEADELRSELSLPVEFTKTPTSERGFVTGFEPRLILPTLRQDSPETDEDDGGDPIDIPISRR